MAEPFVFSFCPGAGGRLETMIMIDLDARCPLCRQPALQRFYHSTPFHPFTLVHFDRLADEAALKAGFSCEQCATSVGSADILRSALTYAFADDAGQIRRINHLDDGSTTYLLTPRHRLDPQALPLWEPDPDDDGPQIHRRSLTESDLKTTFERPFNLKLAWRDLGDQALEQSTPSIATPTPHLVIGIAPDRALLDQHLTRRADAHFSHTHSLELIPLSIDRPWSPSIPTPTARGGRWPTFLSPPVVDALRQDKLFAAALVDPQPAVAMVERTLTTARLHFQSSSSALPDFSSITAPGTDRSVGDLSTRSILHRAVDSGMTPGAAARLGAEELVAYLLDLWT